MKYKEKINGVTIEGSDGNIDTDDITELHGEYVDDAENQLIESCISTLKKRGYIIGKEK